MKISLKDIKRKVKKEEFSYIDSAGNNILLLALKHGSLKLALKIIKTGKINIKHSASDGTTALFYAIICKSPRLMKVLLKAGEEIEPEKCGVLGSPLLWASRAGANNIVAYLIKNGAKIDRQTTPKQYTPLMGACFTLKERTILKLLSYRANTKLKNSEGLTALNIYKRSGGKNSEIENLLQK